MSSHLSGIQHEVWQYLLASMSLLAGKKDSHGEFMLTSQSLQHKKGKYTDEELTLMNEIMHRVSIKLET